MSHIISIHYLIEFLIFISIIPNSISIETKIKLAFLNGFNVIRCSDNQVQVYEQDEEPKSVLSTILNCNNKESILHNGYAGFLWNKLEIICTSTPDQVHEELSVERKFDGNGGVSNKLPDAEGQLGRSKEPYELQVSTDDDDEEITVIKSKDQKPDNSYFEGKSKKRTIYIWFSDHPIICRIQFQGKENNPCSSENDQKVENVNYACYYTPGADEKPTIEQMTAEFKQVKEAEKPDDKKVYVLNLDRPEISADDSLDSDEDDDPKNPSNSNSKNSGKKKTPLPSNSPKNKKKSSIGKIIGLIFGILLLLCLIGGIAFYFIQKNRSKQSSVLSSSSSVNIETGNNKGASVPVQNKSQQSLPHTGGMQNQLSTKDKPNIALQTAAEKKRQRAGTSMGLNDDI